MDAICYIFLRGGLLEDPSREPEEECGAGRVAEKAPKRAEYAELEYRKANRLGEREKAAPAKVLAD